MVTSALLGSTSGSLPPLTTPYLRGFELSWTVLRANEPTGLVRRSLDRRGARSDDTTSRHETLAKAAGIATAAAFTLASASRGRAPRSLGRVALSQAAVGFSLRRIRCGGTPIPLSRAAHHRRCRVSLHHQPAAPASTNGRGCPVREFETTGRRERGTHLSMCC